MAVHQRNTAPSPTQEPPLTIARVALYARVSTSDQSPESQLRDLRQYATARGLEILEYVDTGFSGAKQNRPALDRLMEDGRKRRFDCILVWRFDRFARSTKHLLLALEEFRSLGIQFISYQENIDTTSPLGRRSSRSCRRLHNLNATSFARGSGPACAMRAPSARSSEGPASRLSLFGWPTNARVGFPGPRYVELSM